MAEMQAVQKKTLTVRELLESAKDSIQAVLPKYMSADRFLKAAISVWRNVAAIRECDPTSLVRSVIQVAELGLELNPLLGEAYLVPYKDKRLERKVVQLIVGYRGLLKLARRSGEISTVEVRAVHEGDRFLYSFGLDPKLVHEPCDKPGPLVAVWAVARLKDGGYQWDVMRRSEIDAIRKRSKASDSGPWVTDYDAMARKTVLRRMAKLMPMSVEMASAVALDEAAEVGLPQMDILPEGASDGELPGADEKPASLDALTNKLEADAVVREATAEREPGEDDLTAEEAERLFPDGGKTHARAVRRR